MIVPCPAARVTVMLLVDGKDVSVSTNPVMGVLAAVLPTLVVPVGPVTVMGPITATATEVALLVLPTVSLAAKLMASAPL